MTKNEKQHYAKLARLGCVLCKRAGITETDTPVEIHHVRRFGGKRNLAPAIPLCAIHHRLGNTSIHGLGAKGFTKYWGISPEDLINDTEKLLNEQIC